MVPIQNKERKDYMKLVKKLRKGFTLIELVVVIAVIAILSAVAVVSYISITNKAKRSSDEQAVAQMNTILKANEVMDLRSIKDVFAAFAESGLDAKNYKPLAKDTYFFWDQDNNRIIYVDKNYTVLYPAELKGNTKTDDSHWFSLSGEIQQRDYASDVSGNTYNFTGNATQAGEKLYKLSEDLDAGRVNFNTTEEQTIKLPAKVDLAGSEFNLGEAQNLTIEGVSAENPTEIDNFFTSEYQSLGSTENRKTRQYGAGLVQKVEAGTVTFKNLVFKNATIGDYSISMAAIFAGSVEKTGKLVIENCVIEDANIYGEQKVSAFVAYMAAGTVEIKNCTLKNVNIYTEEGCAGGITGLKASGAALSCDATTAASIKNNVQCHLNKVGDRSYFTVPAEATGGALVDGSNEVVSTCNYITRVGETVEGRTRCKPSCATFGWINNGSVKPDGVTYIVSYGLNPIHESQLHA